MGHLKDKMKKAVRSVDSFYYYCVIKKATIAKVDAAKKLWKQVDLTPDQIREIEEIYGPGIDTRWHRHYQYYTGKFDAGYLPEIIFSPVMECKLNPKFIAREMEDKSRIPILYASVPNMKIPETVVLNAAGICYDKSGNVLSEAQADALVRNYLAQNGEAVIKPTRNTGGGEGVSIVSADNFDGLPHAANFIIQERIINQEDLRQLNPNSLNTMRVITYICDGQYWCAPIALRMGVGSSRLDNICSGGMCIGVRENGELCPYAYIENVEERFSNHPVSKIRFDGYTIKNVEKVIAAAIECHKKTPYMRMASWDFTLNQDGEATLIEVNLTGQSVCFPQYTHGKGIFGDNTRKMLEVLE
ncbi:MAG: sugar-transfer associated ATP-grasp domain-containing protein [Faecousia sp.]